MSVSTKPERPTAGKVVSRRTMSRKDAFLLRMLVLVPLALLFRQLGLPPLVVFATAGLAIIPLAAWIANFTEAIANKIGSFLGGLLNVTFGNVTEIVVSIVALQAGMVEVVKASLVGSIIANLLLGLGFAFILDGLSFKRLDFQHNIKRTTVARINSGSLNLAVVFILMPVALKFTTSSSHQLANANHFSLVASVLLLGFYAMMLFFSMKTHRFMYELEEDAEPESYGSEATGRKYDLWIHVGLLLGFTVALLFVSEVLVDSLQQAVSSLGLTSLFTGVMLLPIFGSAVEIITCGMCAAKQKIDLSISIALGSSLQIAMFVAPALVLVGQAMGQPMNLAFDTFAVLGVGVAVLMTNSVSTDGKSNWLEGVLLLMTYTMLLTAFYLHD
ncbi:MAG: Ca(2+)/H(+) antiporter [Chroococcidiopsis sp. SAG 2025]|nr:Ca(2+)/H(+) antiporter [Chroococcidiopsis sp. SAG 2025]